MFRALEATADGKKGEFKWILVLDTASPLIFRISRKFPSLRKNSNGNSMNNFHSYFYLQSREQSHLMRTRHLAIDDDDDVEPCFGSIKTAARFGN